MYRIQKKRDKKKTINSTKNEVPIEYYNTVGNKQNKATNNEKTKKSSKNEIKNKIMAIVSKIYEIPSK